MSEEKIVKTIDKAIDKLVLIACLILLFFGSYSLLDSYSIYYHAADRSLLKMKQEFESDPESQAITKDMVAWVTLDDTSIDFPIMQGKTNNEYLNKDPYGNFSMSGSIFLDVRNDPSFEDPYNLLYGHHMENYAMFGALDKYLEEDYFNSHETGTLMVKGKKYPLKIFAVVECLSTDQEIFAPNEGYDTVGFMRNTGKFFKEPASDHIVAFSTCKYPNSAERTIVVAAILPAEK